MSSDSKENVRSSSTEDVPLTSIKEPLPVVVEVPASIPTTSKDPGTVTENTSAEPSPKSRWRKCLNCFYDKERGLYCGRTCKSWWCMILYSVMYLIFLSTYTMIFLYLTLTIIKMTDSYSEIDKSELMSYSDNGIGLTVTPTAVYSVPLIAYAYEQPEDFKKYVEDLDKLLAKRRKREISNFTDLGPCGVAPYGYGKEPCVIIRLNKQMKWSAKPLNESRSDLSKDMQDWMKLKEQKLWLHCNGYHSYDKEHIGRIKYYPYPPGIDPGIFPLDMKKDTPLIAVRISNFTKGLSIAVECKLWYDSGVSSVKFFLYVEPKSRLIRTSELVN